MAKAKKITQLSDLTPDQANANKGTERGRYMVEASLTETGAGRSIVADKDGRIIAGNKTLEAWAGMGGAVKVVETDGHELVVVQRTDLDLSDPKGKARKLAYYDNRAGQVGLEWDAEQLLADVNAGVDLAAMFKTDEIAELLAGVKGGAEADAEPQIDQAEELNKKWQVKPGDLWRIGAHRLLCGDSTKAADVARVMGGEKAELLFTSPPYADMREYKGGDVSVSNLTQFVGVFAPYASYQVVNLGMKREGGAIVRYWDGYISAAEAAGMKLLAWNVWDKGRATSIATQSAMFAIEHEWLFVFGSAEKAINRTVDKSGDSAKRAKYFRKDSGGRAIRGVREADGTFKDSPIGANYAAKNMPSIVQCFPQMARDITKAHAAPFPLELPSAYIAAMTDLGQTVVEPFAGSGTTLVACENLGRKCRAVEISPAYCAVILERMAQAFPKLEITRDDAE
jgi:DNA modification methylase